MYLGSEMPRGDLKVAGVLSSRSVSLERTYIEAVRYGKKIGVTRVGMLTGLDRIGISVSAAYRPNSKSLSVSQGKGLTDLAAKVSALMETIEAYQAEILTGPLHWASRAELATKYRAVSLLGLPLTPGVDISEGTSLLWYPMRDINSSEEVYVPFELVHTSYTRSGQVGPSLFNASTNGLASGNNLQEAILHGLCELIERDAVTLWQLKTELGHDAPRIDLGKACGRDAEMLRERFTRANVRIGCWDITSDIGVPVCLCVCTDGGDDASGISAAGMGCHPDSQVAVSRAMAEAAQSRATIISGARDDLFPADYLISQIRENTIRDRGLIDGSSNKETAHSAGGGSANLTVGDDLRDVIAKLDAMGLSDVLVADLSPVEAELSVARIIVPGLEALSWAGGYAPGARAKRVMNER